MVIFKWFLIVFCLITRKGWRFTVRVSISSHPGVRGAHRVDLVGNGGAQITLAFQPHP